MSKTLKKKKHWSGKVQECSVSWGDDADLGAAAVDVQGGAESGEFPHLGPVLSEAVVCHVGRSPGPGDVLLEVNGTPVSGLTNRDTLAVIRHFREPIRLKTVKPGDGEVTHPPCAGPFLAQKTLRKVSSPLCANTVHPEHSWNSSESFAPNPSGRCCQGVQPHPDPESHQSDSGQTAHTADSETGGTFIQLANPESKVAKPGGDENALLRNGYAGADVDKGIWGISGPYEDKYTPQASGCTANGNKSIQWESFRPFLSGDAFEVCLFALDVPNPTLRSSIDHRLGFYISIDQSCVGVDLGQYCIKSRPSRLLGSAFLLLKGRPGEVAKLMTDGQSPVVPLDTPGLLAPSEYTQPAALLPSSVTAEEDFSEPWQFPPQQCQ
ncbi:Membrane-associated guanylate kinase, WW and PDZ domain-containing protein 3 [Merluccius polli]|uniref:Membrane-associated guanylate kinase, WW and PDZ domain-containing protein 3 n=1 Tax=Merluccius polli TaxID=89951 RepID=A0AA47MSK2_MERPO|nr:Membrane-associated guanylate kinase, WW and PDZ domain-containing protein 3 [Merluccius polli]